MKKEENIVTWSNYMNLEKGSLTKEKIEASKDVIVVILRMKQATKGNIFNNFLLLFASLGFFLPVLIFPIVILVRQLKKINLKLEYLSENGLKGVLDIEGWVKSIPGTFTNWNFAYTPERIKRINRAYEILGGRIPLMIEIQDSKEKIQLEKLSLHEKNNPGKIKVRKKEINSSKKNK